MEGVRREGQGKKRKTNWPTVCVGGYGAVYDKACSDPRYWGGGGDGGRGPQ